MKYLRLGTTVILLLCICFSLSCASAATLITNFSDQSTQSSISIIPITSIKSSTRREDTKNNIIFRATNLLDGNPKTTWQPTVRSYQDFYRNGFGEYLTLTFGSRSTVSEIWIRNGHCQSLSYYTRNAKPATFTVTFKEYQGNHLVSCAQPLSFRMDDRYDTTTYNEDWRDGYQCLRLPEPISVDAITLTIDDVYRSSRMDGNDNWYYVCMSDLYVVGTPY